jgi:hypothetical protein
MRKITESSVDAFIKGYNFNEDNTKVSICAGGITRMYLHDNLIAERFNSDIKITNCGWATNVTKERLNGIPGVSISQVRGDWVLNGNPWDGSWIKI